MTAVSKTRTRRSNRLRRHARLRARVRGTATRPRLSVFRSKKHLVVQVIDDVSGRTLLAVHDGMLPRAATARVGNASPGVERAQALGGLLAERAKQAGIQRLVFDRGGYAYHGRVKALADGAREGGLEL